MQLRWMTTHWTAESARPIPRNSAALVLRLLRTAGGSDPSARLGPRNASSRASFCSKVSCSSSHSKSISTMSSRARWMSTNVCARVVRRAFFRPAASIVRGSGVRSNWSCSWRKRATSSRSFCLAASCNGSLAVLGDKCGAALQCYVTSPRSINLALNRPPPLKICVKQGSDARPHDPHPSRSDAHRTRFAPHTHLLGIVASGRADRPAGA
jgi:hypothetical protein